MEGYTDMCPIDDGLEPGAAESVDSQGRGRDRNTCHQTNMAGNVGSVCRGLAGRRGETNVNQRTGVVYDSSTRPTQLNALLVLWPKDMILGGCNAIHSLVPGFTPEHLTCTRC